MPFRNIYHSRLFASFQGSFAMIRLFCIGIPKQILFSEIFGWYSAEVLQFWGFSDRSCRVLLNKEIICNSLIVTFLYQLSKNVNYCELLKHSPTICDTSWQKNTKGKKLLKFQLHEIHFSPSGNSKWSIEILWGFLLI